MKIWCLVERDPDIATCYVSVRAFEDEKKSRQALHDRMVELDKIGWANRSLSLVPADIET